MSKLREYRLLKDGISAFESVNRPDFALFLMLQLKPEHEWTIEKIKYTEKEREIHRLKTEIAHLETIKNP